MKKTCIKKPLAFAVILLFIGVSVAQSTETVVVEKTPLLTSRGKTLYVGGTGEGNYSSIQDAIDNASDGDTVFVYNGTYYEHVLIDKIINLIGENNETTIIDGSKVGTVVTVVSHHVNISGFTIQNSGTITDNVGILIRTNFNTIKDNIILNNYHYGIHLIKAHYNVIHNNLICLTYTDGIYLADSNNNNISSNVIINNGWWGIQVYFSSSNNKFINNKICNNNDGITLWITSENNYIAGNNISSNNRDGIMIFDHSTNNVIIRNSISNNFYGVYIGSYGNQNLIFQNNFINNKINSFFRINWINRNKWDNNYWNKPRSLPKPIFGIVTIIPWIAFDWHPAKEPYDIGV